MSAFNKSLSSSKSCFIVNTNNSSLASNKGEAYEEAANPFIENFLTKKQLADKLSVSVSYINKLLKRGLPKAPTGGRAVRFRYSEVVNWLQKRS